MSEIYKNVSQGKVREICFTQIVDTLRQVSSEKLQSIHIHDILMYKYLICYVTTPFWPYRCNNESLYKSLGGTEGCSPKMCNNEIVLVKELLSV